jgi:DNA-binding NarL/FixJ family response regulator
MIRILVADDHTIMRQGLVQLLADIEDCQVAGQAASGFEVLEKIRAESFDVVLLDLTMPGRHGVDLIRQIKEQYALRALQAGASGYLTKESAADELIAAIRKVVDGESYISALIARSLAMSLVRPETRPPHSDLSNREFQVLMMIAEGRALTEIAAELSLSAKTISTYKTRVLEKLKLDDTAALIRYALEHGLIEDRRVPPAPQ